MAQAPTPIFPQDSSQPPGHGGPSRSEDIGNAVELGRKRAEQEATFQRRLREERGREEVQSRTVLRRAEEKRDQEKARKKGYRTRMSARERELTADHRERERQEKLVAETKEKLSQQRKKEQESMQELHESASVKFAMERRKNEAKRAEEAERQRAEGEYRHKLVQAEQTERMSADRIERDVRSRKGIVDTETREKLFKLETLKRLKMHELESLTNRELAAAKSDDLFAFERKRAAIATLARGRIRRAEAELEEKKQAILAEDRTQKLVIDADATIQRGEAAGDRRRAIQDADRWYSSRLNEIERVYKE